jgi:hypothetical protein
VQRVRRIFKKAVQRDRGEQRSEAYTGPYVEPLREARTKVAAFFNILLNLSIQIAHRFRGSIGPPRFRGRPPGQTRLVYHPPTLCRSSSELSMQASPSRAFVLSSQHTCRHHGPHPQRLFPVPVSRAGGSVRIVFVGANGYSGSMDTPGSAGARDTSDCLHE